MNTVAREQTSPGASAVAQRMLILLDIEKLMGSAGMGLMPERSE